MPCLGIKALRETSVSTHDNTVIINMQMMTISATFYKVVFLIFCLLVQSLPSGLYDSTIRWVGNGSDGVNSDQECRSDFSEECYIKSKCSEK